MKVGQTSGKIMCLPTRTEIIMEVDKTSSIVKIGTVRVGEVKPSHHNIEMTDASILSGDVEPKRKVL